MFMKIITALSTPDAVKYGLTLIDDVLQSKTSADVTSPYTLPSHIAPLCAYTHTTRTSTPTADSSVYRR